MPAKKTKKSKKLQQIRKSKESEMDAWSLDDLINRCNFINKNCGSRPPIVMRKGVPSKKKDPEGKKKKAILKVRVRGWEMAYADSDDEDDDFKAPPAESLSSKLPTPANKKQGKTRKSRKRRTCSTDEFLNVDAAHLASNKMQMNAARMSLAFCCFFG